MALTIKQRAHQVIEALSDDATWQELLCALELRSDVEAGLADAKVGRVTDTDELRREYGLRQ
jgi:predicted transcriptional regulator